MLTATGKSAYKNVNLPTKAEKRNIEKQLKKAGNPKAKVKVSKKK